MRSNRSKSKVIWLHRERIIVHCSIPVRDRDDKLVVLHEINTTITTLRTRNGMAPIDDALWGERANVFQTIRLIIIPINGKLAEGILGAAAGRDPSGKSNIGGSDEQRTEK